MASTSDKRAYLDYNATSPLRPEARRVMIETMETFGNPSSIHAEGRAARAIVEQARREVADLAGVSPRRVVFVGGGTDTKKAVRVPDKELALSVTLAGASAPKPLILKAAPNELAEEKEVDCSHFEGTADWLNGAKKFTATGTVTFKGRQQEIRVEYPAGYDPDDAGADAGMKR